MKTLFISFITLTATALGASPPNIVIIYADDQGSGDFGLQNPGGKIATPNLDKLAAQGLRFTDGHSSSGVCSPSRYAMLSGRYHWRQGHGIVDVYGPPWFNQGRLTIPAMLREKGYRTACIGKWHLGWDWQAIRNPGLPILSPNAFDWSKPVPGGPLDRGFDYYFGDDVPNFPPYTWIENDRILVAPSVPFKATPAPTAGDEAGERMSGHDCRNGAMAAGWRLDAVMPRLTERAVEWIAAQKGSNQPFFLYWPWTAPHTPVVPIEKFKGTTKAGAYGDYLHQCDAHLGEVLAALDENGFAENTLVIFTSDNGAESIAYERIQKHGHRSSGSLRGVKRDLWEGGHRVPFLVRWPGKITPGKVSGELVSQVDLMATLAAVVDYRLPAGAAEDSYNLLPLWTLTAPGPRITIIHNTNKNAYAVRHLQWLLVDTKSGGVSKVPAWFDKENGYLPDDQPGELYDLSADLAQKNNLFAAQPDRVAELKSLLAGIRAKGQAR